MPKLFYVDCEQGAIYLWTEEGWEQTALIPQIGDHVVCFVKGKDREYVVSPNLTRIPVLKRKDKIWAQTTPDTMFPSITS